MLKPEKNDVKTRKQAQCVMGQSYIKRLKYLLFICCQKTWGTHQSPKRNLRFPPYSLLGNRGLVVNSWAQPSVWSAVRIPAREFFFHISRKEKKTLFLSRFHSDVNKLWNQRKKVKKEKRKKVKKEKRKKEKK